MICGFIGLPKLHAQELLTPSDQQLLHRASGAYEAERYIEVIDLLEDFLETPVEHADPWLLLAGSHIALHDFQAAAETLDRALTVMPEHVQLLRGRADVHLEREEYKDALQIFNTLYQQALKKGVPAGEVDPIVRRITALNNQLGGEAVQENRLDHAEGYFRDALNHQPDSLHSYTNLAFVKIENDNPEGALEVVDSGLEQFPGHPNLQKMKASILSSLKDARALEEVLADLVTLEPENLDLTGNYLTLLLHNENYDEADRFVKKVLDDESLGSDRYLVLAGAYENAGYTTGQIGILQRYQQKYPGDTDVELKTAALLASVNETEKAKIAYRELAESGNAEAGQELARLYVADDSLDTAANIYKNLIVEHPDDVNVIWDYTVVLNQMDRPDEAIGPLERILELTDDPRFEYERALAGDRAGEKVRALEKYEELAESGFYHPAMFLRLAEDGRSIPGLGEGCEMVQSLFGLVVSQSMQKQESILASIQNESVQSIHREDTRREPAETDLNELDEISQSVILEISEQCGANGAEEFIEELLQTHGSSGRMHMIASSFYKEERNQPDQALELAEQAAELSPNLAEAHLYHARLLEASNEMDKARLAYERVIALDDRHEEAYSALLRIYRNSNRLDELCDRWVKRYHTNRENEILWRYLHQGLLRAGRWEEVQALQE